MEFSGRVTAEHEGGEFLWGLGASMVGHVLLGAALLSTVGGRAHEFNEVVYSITIEGGKTLGGISQVPDEKAKIVQAVPRNVSKPEQKTPERPTEIETEPVKLEPPEPEAEVSVATPVPTKAPTPRATPRPKATQKLASKPTPVPTKKPTPRGPTKAELNKEYQATMQKYLGESSRAGGKGFGAAAATGGSGMGGGVLRPPEFFRYRDLLETFVKSGWRWIDPQSRLSAAVVFSIAPDGAVSDVRIERSSGNREFDESVLRAVYKANPVPRPPPSVYEEYFRSVRMIFEPQ